MRRDDDEVRDALIRQWQVIAAAVPTVDLDAESRVEGWRNREVVAHLALQPVLLARFLATASAEEPMSLADNLSGTRSRAQLIAASAREGAEAGRVDFLSALRDVLPPLSAADLTATVVSIQGPIRLVDYLVTRCVEGVVHGRDLVGPIDPDPIAEAITAEALLGVLSERAPHLVAEAQDLPPSVWIDVATGRRATSGELASAVPVMT